MKLDPVLLSEKYVYSYTVYYAIAAVWGFVAVWNGIASIYQTGGASYEAFWTAAVFIISAVLAWLTTTNFARAEKWLTIAWVIFVSAYPTAIAFQWLVVGNSAKAAPSISTLLYLVFPAARYIYLIRKTKKRNG